MNVHRNLSTRKAIEIARHLDIEVFHRNGNSELIFQKNGRFAAQSGTRKDANRWVRSFLRRCGRQVAS